MDRSGGAVRKFRTVPWRRTATGTMLIDVDESSPSDSIALDG
jgi:hypothetical protein